jgi:hypothetical protein
MTESDGGQASSVTQPLVPHWPEVLFGRMPGPFTPIQCRQRCPGRQPCICENQPGRQPAGLRDSPSDACLFFGRVTNPR